MQNIRPQLTKVIVQLPAGGHRVDKARAPAIRPGDGHSVARDLRFEAAAAIENEQRYVDTGFAQLR
jgi:hypothetical protein